MPPSRHLFRPENGRPAPTAEARDLVAYLQALGRARRDLWAEWRRRDQVIPSPPRVDADLLRRGDDLYRHHCASCHGQEGDGRGEAAPFFSLPPRDFVAGRYRFKSTPAGQPPEDADLYRSITLGTGLGSAMPAFYWLGEGDRWSLVLRVKEFSPALRGTGLSPPGPAGPRDSESAASHPTQEEGRRLWDDLGCASCHGPSGAGMTRAEAGADWNDGGGVIVPRSGDLTHACALRGGASERAVERAVRFGVGEAMPAYADALSDRSKRRALVSFLMSLQGGRRTEPEGATSRRTPGPPSPSPSPAP